MTEYVGEILDYEQFKARTDQYHDEKRKDFYFMSLTADEMIDATQKGNMSRFMNHSCDPNCETQKVDFSVTITEWLTQFANLSVV